MNVHFNKIINVVCFSLCTHHIDLMMQSYDAALSPTSLHLLNLLQSQSSLIDGMPHDQRYHHTKPMSSSWLHNILSLSVITLSVLFL